jgi:hypothetical protein
MRDSLDSLKVLQAVYNEGSGGDEMRMMGGCMREMRTLLSLQSRFLPRNIFSRSEYADFWMITSGNCF